MPRRAARRAPTYLFFDQARDGWYLRFRHVDTLGRRHWPRERSPWPADYRRSVAWAPIRRAELIAEIEADLRRLDPEKPRTLGEVLDTYAADARSRGVAWTGGEEYRAEVLRQAIGPETPWTELTPAAIAALRNQLRDDRARVRLERDGAGEVKRTRAPLSPRSLNAYVNLLQAALNLAVRRREIPHNPLAGLGRLREPDAEPTPFSDAQLVALFVALEDWKAEAAAELETVHRGEATYERRRPDHLRPRARLAERVILGYYAFARPEALDAVRWRDVDLDRRLLVFQRSKGHRQVVVPLEAPALLALAELRAGLASPPAPDDLVLGGVRNYRKQWARLIRLANGRLEDGVDPIPPTARLHNLRHTRITNALRDGMTPQAVAQLAGTSIRMIYRHYARYLDDALREEIDRAVVRRAEREGGQTVGQTKRGITAPVVRRRATRQRTQPADPALTN